MATTLVLAGMSVSVRAVGPPINYGTFTGSNIQFQNVTEDSATDSTPLYGAPTVSGDGMSFSPTAAFSATTSGGGVDLTDGKLNTTLQAINTSAFTIHNIRVNERGDYTLFGSGTSATAASVGAAVYATLTQVDGLSITPVALPNANLTFTPSGGTYDLINDPGIAVTWTGTLFYDVDAALASLGITGRATRINFAMDNTLFAASQSGSVALIEKKAAFVDIIINDIPEPSALVLTFIGSLALGWQTLRRRIAPRPNDPR